MLLKISNPPNRARASGMALLDRRIANYATRKVSPSAPSQLIRRVAILIETTGSYGRGLLRGITQYNRKHLGWYTCFHPSSLDREVPAWLRNWRGDGILARVETRELADLIAKLDVPIVNLSGKLSSLPFTYVGTSEAGIAQVAAQHLIERGLINFAFIGPQQGEHPGFDERCRAFQACVASMGRPCQVYPEEHLPRLYTWDFQQNQLARWIRTLPKPVGVLACNDERSMHVLDACRRCGAIVPDEVAVIGVDNDEHLCSLAAPSLSSVDVNTPEIGYTAAATLDRLMRGQRNVPPAQYVPPQTIVTRLSTDTLATKDEEVNRTLRYIHAHAGERLPVSSVLRHVQLCRSTMQKRVKKVTGHGILAAIRRVRLTRAKYLLLTSGQSIDQIAITTGFSSAQHLTRRFRLAYGETPSAYRGRSAPNRSNTSETADDY